MEFLWTFKKKNTINPYLLTERPEVTPKNICIELNRYLIDKPVTINSHVWAHQAIGNEVKRRFSNLEIYQPLEKQRCDIY